MAIKHNDNIRTKGIEIIPETDRYGSVTWMFRFARIDDSRQSSDDYPGPFEALAEALHTLRKEGEDSRWQEHLMKAAEAQKHDGNLGDGDRVSIWRWSERHSSVMIERESGSEDNKHLSPNQALSLLAWLKQNEDELERMTKEQDAKTM